MAEDKRIKAYIEAAENLRNLIAEARGIRRDLAADLKATKEKAQKEVKDYIDGQVRIQLELLGKQTESAMAQAVARVDNQFTKLANLYIKGMDDEKPSLDELMAQAAKAMKRPSSDQINKFK